MDEIFTEIIQNCSYGWEHVLQSLVQFGVLLIDLFSSKGQGFFFLSRN